MAARLIGALFAVLLLASCSGLDSQPDVHTIQRLLGSWHQVDGRATLTFYDDEGVKLDMPDEHPPMRLLSSVERIKDHGIGFSIGDRWTEPAYLTLSPDGKSLKLLFPSTAPKKGDGRTINFERTR